MRPCHAALRLCVLVAVLAPAGTCATDAHAGAHTRINTRIDPSTGRVAGRVSVVFENITPAPLDRVYVWLLPNRLATPPAALNDVNHYWIYPRRFNPGSMRITDGRAGPVGTQRALTRAAWRPADHAIAGERVLWTANIPVVAPGERARVEFTYDARIPARYGSLGCVDGQCTLMGGFYPMLATLDEAGWDVEAGPMRTAMDVRIELLRDAAIVVFDRAFGATATRIAAPSPAKPTGEPVFEARASHPDAPYATVMIAPRLYESTQRAASGALLRYLSPEPPPPADDARDHILPYTQENHARFALDGAVEVIELLGAIKAPVQAEVITMVRAPLRFALAEAHPGQVVVSDRFYRIWPARRFRKFHQRQLVRAIIADIAGRAIARSRAYAGRDVPVAADVIASYLTDVFVLKQYKKAEFVGDILRPVSFIPVVDQLLYAPQTMFSGAYFGGVIDDEPLRDHPMRFMHHRPRGRLYYEKLRDLMKPDALRAAMRAMIADGTHYRTAAEAAYGASLDWFFRQWSVPYPRLNYRLERVSSTLLGRGSYEHAITVRRDVARSDSDVVEPVHIRVILDDGARRDLRWDGRGRRGVVRFRADQAIDRVMLDPMRRLVERKLPGEVAHPRFDNQSKHRLRFVYNSFGVILNVTDVSALLAADFTLSRVHDVKHRARFLVFSSAASRVGASVQFTRRFGRTITPDRLASSLTARITAQRLRSGFFGDDEREASRLSLGLRLSASDLLNVFEPRFVSDFAIGGSVTVTRRDATSDARADSLVTGVLSANLSRTRTLWGDHTVALELDGALVLGDIATQSQLIGIGGAGGLRGYAPGALFGRASALARAEYRHVFVHDLNWNIGHYNFVRGLGGALFVDAGALTPCDGYDVARASNFYASAGYGVRAFYDSFGTLPQMMRVDVAVSLVDHQRACLGEPAGAFPRVMVYIGFVPPF